MASKQAWNTAITDNDSTAQEQLGSVRKEYNTTDSCYKIYRYCQCSLSAAATNGICLSWYDTKATVATDDVSTSSRNLPAGVATGTITDDYYAWIQVGGYHSAVDTNADDDISDGDTIILSSTDGKCDSVAAGTAPTYKPLGVAVADDVDASDTVATQLDCLYGDIIQ